MQDIDSADQVVSLRAMFTTNPLKCSNVNIIVERWCSVVVQKTDENIHQKTSR